MSDSPLATHANPTQQATSHPPDSKEAKLADIQEQIDKLIAEREKLKG